MSTESALPKDHPAIIAWEAYRASPEYANSRQWAATQHVDGSMWAAFYQGFISASASAAIDPSPSMLEALERLSKEVAVFDEEVAAELAVGLDRADFWTEIEVNVVDLRTVLTAVRSLTLDRLDQRAARTAATAAAPADVFSTDDVVALANWQMPMPDPADPFKFRGHPFTCANRGDGNHRNVFGDLGALVPTVRGWICPFCDYTQAWAHGFMKAERS